MWRLLVSLSLVFSLVACSQFKRSNVADEKDPYYLEGERRQSGLDYEGAIQSFERALQSNPNNAAAHFRLGGLYSDKKKDFAAAIYHYQKHLNLYTNSPRADQIVQQINYCKRELARGHSIAFASTEVQRQMERLTMTNEIYAKRIQELEAELARGPRYITNIETKYVAMPDLEQKGGRGLTRPTTIVDSPPQQQQEQAKVETPEPTPPKQTKSNPQQETRVAASAQQEAQRESSNRERDGRETPRKTAPRNSASSGSRVRTVHTVKPGDTLDAVARRYGVSASELRAANPGLGRGTRAGQKINIPNK